MVGFRPLVSVIIPVFNGVQFIEKAVRSVCEQTVQDFEIIVVDDGSTDGTQQVLRQMEKNFEIQWHQQDHSGPACARNTGIQHARGSYLALLDCDDMWLPLKLEIQLNVMKQCPDIGVVHSDFEIVGEDGTVQEHVKAGENKDPFVQAFVDGHTALVSTLLVRRTAIDKIGGFDPSLYYGSEDTDFAFRLYRVSKMECVDQVLVRKLRRNETDKVLAIEDWEYAAKCLESRRLFLENLHRLGNLTKKQEKALSREWANYYMQKGSFFSRRGDHVKSRKCYWKGLCKAPFRFRLYSRLVRTFVN